jgi:hypothetical protein
MQSGVSRLLGVSVQKHWIAVRTNTAPRFVVLRFENTQIREVLAAFEKRTWRPPPAVRKRARTS